MVFDFVYGIVESIMENLNELINNLIEKVNNAGLETSAGNCGMFALALKEVLGVGDLVFATNSSYPEYATDNDAEENLLCGEPDIWHIALKLGINCMTALVKYQLMI